MDISKIRKKIKKAEASDKKKTREKPQKGEPVQPEAEIDEGTKVVHAEAEPEQKDIKEPAGAIPDAAGEETSETVAGTKAEARESEEKKEDKEEKDEESVVVDETEIIAFKTSDEEYAVRVDQLQEIINYQRITAVPRSAKYLLGVTSVRGRIMPVIDLGLRLGLAEKQEEKQKILILYSKKGPLGVLIGAIVGVFRFPEEQLLPPPSTLGDEEKEFIEGVVRVNDKFISVLQVEKLLKIEAL